MPSASPQITHQFPTPSAAGGDTHFQSQYIALREKENRLYSDEQVRQLPLIERSHPHYREWLIRKGSLNRLIKHLRKMQRPLNILEVGCGNGWLANRLAEIPSATVTGFDINLEELDQAKRVFGDKSNLHFKAVNPFLFKNNENSFDIIIFAASIQYFSAPAAIIHDALQHLQPDGSIHIIDTHFYRAEEVPAARQRTIDHFTSLGFPEFADHYFHHSLAALDNFNYCIRHDPRSLRNRLIGRRGKNPFYWIIIQKP